MTLGYFEAKRPLHSIVRVSKKPYNVMVFESLEAFKALRHRQRERKRGREGEGIIFCLPSRDAVCA